MAELIKGSEKLRRQLQSIPDLLAVPIKKQIAEGLQQVQKTAQQNAPVRTGALKKSIKTEIETDGLKGRVYSDAPHAHLVEFGTVNAPAQPFMFPAWRENRNKIVRGIKRAADSALQAMGRTPTGLR